MLENHIEVTNKQGTANGSNKNTKCLTQASYTIRTKVLKLNTQLVLNKNQIIMETRRIENFHDQKTDYLESKQKLAPRHELDTKHKKGQLWRFSLTDTFHLNYGFMICTPDVDLTSRLWTQYYIVVHDCKGYSLSIS